MPVLGSVAIIASNVPGLFEWGYVLLGIGATFIGLDKFFAYSSGWTRYILTAQFIQKTIYSFEIDWTKLQARLENRTPQQSEIEGFLQTAKGLYESILLQITHETQQWASEFQQSISNLEATTKAKVKSSEPGATISGAKQLDSQPEVMIDEVSYGHVDGGSWAVSKIAPGQHAVRVVSSLNGRSVQASDVVSVSPGGKALIALSLA